MTTDKQTKAQLCKALGVHRTQLDRFLARAGAPKADKGRRYSVREVAAFIGAQQAPLTNLRDARLREIGLRCQKLERELALQSRSVITVAEHDQFTETLCRATRDAMFFGFTAELPPKLAGMDVVEIRRTLRDYGDDVCRRMIAKAEQFRKSYVESAPQ